MVALAIIMFISGCLYKVPEKSKKVAESIDKYWFPDHSEITTQTLKP